jgi:hypothetical protein
MPDNDEFAVYWSSAASTQKTVTSVYLKTLKEFQHITAKMLKAGVTHNEHSFIWILVSPTSHKCYVDVQVSYFLTYLAFTRKYCDGEKISLEILTMYTFFEISSHCLCACTDVYLTSIEWLDGFIHIWHLRVYPLYVCPVNMNI